MWTACALRRMSWSHLLRVSQGVGSNYVSLRSPQTLILLRDRSFSASSGNASIFEQGTSAPTASRPGYLSAYLTASREGRWTRGLSDFRRVSGIYSLNSHGDDQQKTRSSVAPVDCNSRRGNQFHSHSHSKEAFEVESEHAEPKSYKWLTLERSDDCTSLQSEDVERRHSALWDKLSDGRNSGSWAPLSYPSSADIARRLLRFGRIRGSSIVPQHCRSYSSAGASQLMLDPDGDPKKVFDYSQRAVVTAIWCNFLVFSLKTGVWIMTTSHVMLAEAIHSLADLANQGLIAYGLMSSRRAPDAMHPYGYSKERFVWSLISAVGIFCLGSGATIIHGVQNLWTAQPLENAYLAALVLGGSMIMEGASLLVAISCVRNGAKAEGMTVRDYLWRGHDPTTVAVMMEDGAAVTGLAIAALALTAAHYTGNPMWDPIGSIVVGNLLGAVAIFLIQRNRQALLGRSMDETDMVRVMDMLSKDPVVDAIYDCKSEVIGPGAYRFKAEIDFNGVTIVQNYIQRAGRGNWHKEFQDAVSTSEPGDLDRVMAAYGEEVVAALGSEVDRLEREIQKVVPGIRHVDIEAHNPHGPAPRERLYLDFRPKIKL